MKKSPTLNLQTYPNEPIYVPDMLVAIVALNNFSRQNNNLFLPVINEWLHRAKAEWIDRETGLLKSFLDYEGKELAEPIKGSYSALICYYLTFIDEPFAKEQYNLLKKHFAQKGLLLTSSLHTPEFFLE